MLVNLRSLKQTYDQTNSYGIAFILQGINKQIYDLQFCHHMTLMLYVSSCSILFFANMGSFCLRWINTSPFNVYINNFYSFTSHESWLAYWDIFVCFTVASHMFGRRCHAKPELPSSEWYSDIFDILRQQMNKIMPNRYMIMTTLIWKYWNQFWKWESVSCRQT